MQDGSEADDLFDQLLSLFTPAAIADSHMGKSEGTTSAAEALLDLFNASASAKRAELSPKHMKAALGVMDPDLYAALSSEDQTALSVVRTHCLAIPEEALKRRSLHVLQLKGGGRCAKKLSSPFGASFNAHLKLAHPVDKTDGLNPIWAFPCLYVLPRSCYHPMF